MSTYILRAVHTAVFTTLFVAASSVNATMIDFTSQEWTGAIGTNNQSVTLWDITVESLANNGTLTYNGGKEVNDCKAGQALHGLACFGDGIGIGDDEITEGGLEKLKVTFAKPMDILDVHLLDLFGSENTGEMGIIMEGSTGLYSFKADPGNPLAGTGPSVAGGYWETGFSAKSVTSLTFYSSDDGFSDYSLARISAKEATSVPEIDAGHSSLALCLLAGLFAIFRERRLKK